jgi:hypothetical protein
VHRRASISVLAALALVAVAVPLLRATPGGAATVVTISSKIDATGKIDVSASMKAFFASVPDGAVVELAPHARYRMDSTLVLNARHRLTIQGNGALFFTTTPGDAQRSNVRIQDSDTIGIYDLAVRGANPHAGVGDAAYQTAREHQHGFEVLSSAYVALVRVTATDVYGDFVYLGRTAHGPWSSVVFVLDSHFGRNGRQGISLAAASWVDIERNSISDVRMDTIDLEPQGVGAGVEHVTVRDNVVGAGRLLFVGADGNDPVNDVTISGNKLHGQALQIWADQPRTGNRNGWTVTGNTSDKVLGNPHGAAMKMTHVNGGEISGNVQPFQAGRNMVMANVVDSCNVVVRSNTRPASIAEARVSGHC